MKERRRPGKIAPFTVKNLFTKPATIVYRKDGPAQPKVEKHYRGRILYDPDDCVDCHLCMKDCPTGAIKIINDGTRQDRKMHAELDLGLCIFCCQCVDSCRRGCLSFSSEINLVSQGKDGLQVDPSMLDGKKFEFPPKPAPVRRPAAAAKPAAPAPAAPAAKPAAAKAPGEPAVNPALAAKLAEAVTPAVTVVPVEAAKAVPAEKPAPAEEKKTEAKGNEPDGTDGK